MAFVAQSVGMDHIGPFTFQAVRCFLAVMGLLPVCMLTDRFKRDGKSFLQRWKDKKLWKAGIFCGIPLFLACNLQQMGLIDTDAGKSAFLTAMYIVLVPLLGVLMGRKLSPMVPVAVVLGVVVVEMAMPAAVNGAMLCMEYNGDIESMAQTIFVTTILSVVTIPLVAMLL